MSGLEAEQRRAACQLKPALRAAGPAESELLTEQDGSAGNTEIAAAVGERTAR